MLLILWVPLGLLLIWVQHQEWPARLIRKTRDRIMHPPKIVAAVVGIGFGVAACANNVVNGRYPQAIPGVAIAAVSVGVLIWLRRKNRAAIVTEDRTVRLNAQTIFDLCGEVKTYGDHDWAGLSGAGATPRFPWNKDHGS
ncbi:hypothetical protein LTV02_18025 [Nocardia yamanashiensis]|uniref:hypothetical protein n=1 Tax=Nocardia yamanashiensis TaxID=209247 RepID=UPI001E524300|nr:hypothetical protein [Nocardia yamanashiensis]UGT45170.1 hypothetical protein LTV02_18025 [Nocardia yamanashiensis]